MKIREYQATKTIGIDIKQRDLLKLFCDYMDTDASEVTNRLYKQWFLNSLLHLEDTYPDQWQRWQQIRQLLHTNKI